MGKYSRYWDELEPLIYTTVQQFGPCDSITVREKTRDFFLEWGRDERQAINDITRVLSDLSGSSPCGHGRYHGTVPPLNCWPGTRGKMYSVSEGGAYDPMRQMALFD